MTLTRRVVSALAAAVLIAWIGEFGPIGAAALIGIGLWLALALGDRRLPLQFAALALFGGVIFGFTAAAFAALHGLSVRQLLALPFVQQPVGIALGLAAVVLATLGVCSGTMAMLSAPPQDTDER